MEHNTAFVFPGQGSQYAGMGRDVAEKYPAARRVFDEIDQALGVSISKLCFEGPEDQLKLTENTQPAILAVSSAIHEVLEDFGATRRDLVAGHSLGEYSAIVSVGGLTPPEAAKIVRARGNTAARSHMSSGLVDDPPRFLWVEIRDQHVVNQLGGCLGIVDVQRDVA